MPPTSSAPDQREQRARTASASPPRAAAARGASRGRRPTAKPGERQRAHDQALGVAPEGHQQGETTMTQSSGVTGRGRVAARRGLPSALRASIPWLPVNELASERHRRLTHRALPALAGSALLRWRGLAGRGAARVRRRARARVRRGLGARRLRGDARAAERRAQRRYPLARSGRAYRRAPPRPPPRESPSASRRASATAPCALPVAVRTRVFGAVRGRAARAGRRRSGSTGRRAGLPRPARGRAPHAPERAAARGRRSCRSTARCWPEGPASARSSPLGASPPRSRARWSPRRPPRSARPSTRAASRATRRSGRAGSSGPSRSGRGAPAAAAAPAAAVAGPTRPRGQAGPHHDRHPPPGGGRAALAGRFGGIAALDPRTARCARWPAIAFSAPQPPGSTFKIVTTAAALEESSSSPRRVPGGDRRARSTASSWRTPTASSAAARSARASPTRATRCSRRSASRWAPQKLVETAERFGWNASATLPGEVPSTLPRRARSCPRSRSARRRSASSRCSPPRCRWRRWPRRSPTTACAARRRWRPASAATRRARDLAQGRPHDRAR